MDEQSVPASYILMPGCLQLPQCICVHGVCWAGSVVPD